MKLAGLTDAVRLSMDIDAVGLHGIEPGDGDTVGDLFAPDSVVIAFTASGDTLVIPDYEGNTNDVIRIRANGSVTASTGFFLSGNFDLSSIERSGVAAVLRRAYDITSTNQPTTAARLAATLRSLGQRVERGR